MYGGYSSFADILSQAKRQSQLRGTNLPTSDIRKIGSGYFSDAADAVNTERSYNLAEAGQTLAAKAQTASENQSRALLSQQAEQFSKNYALQNDQFAQTLAQRKAEEEAQREAAEAAGKQGMVGSGLQTALTAGMLLKGTDIGKAIISGAGKLFDTGKNAVSGAYEALTGAKEVGQGAINYAAADAAAGLMPAEAGSLIAPTATDTAIAAAPELVGVGGGAGAGAEAAGAGLGGFATGAGYAAAAIAAREGLGSILSNQSAETPKWQGKLMKEEPTLEGLSNRVLTDLYTGGGEPSQDMKNVNMVLDPVGTVLKSTWLCTEISKRYGIDETDDKALSKLRRYSIKNHRDWAEKYLTEGHRLIEVMNTKEKIDDKYKELKESLVKTVCGLVREGKLEDAHNKYKEITLNLCEEYGVEP